MKWNEQTLGQICDREGGLIQTGPFGSQLHQSDYREEGIPVVMPQDIVEGRINLSSVAKVAEETADRLARHKLKVGAIVMPRRGEINKRAFIKESEQGYLCGTGCIKIELAGTVLEPYFLYYYLEQPQIVSWIEQHAVGTTMLNLNTTIIRDVLIQFPSLEIQHKAVSILSAYDDLIENNRRRMALLEESARLLYQEWFDRLRFPGHEHTRSVNGVPEGWEKTNALQAISVLSGGTPKTSVPDYWDGDIPFYTPKDAYDHCYVLETERSVTELGLNNCNSRLYPKNTVFISARGTVGKMNLAFQPMAMSQSCYALIGKGHISQFFLYCALYESIQYLKQHAVGTVFDAIIVDTFKLIPFLVPDEKNVRLFEETVAPMFHQVGNLMQQNQKLLVARNLLLPKLMSGEIAV